jgi:hypothetical protein
MVHSVMVLPRPQGSGRDPALPKNLSRTSGEARLLEIALFQGRHWSAVAAHEKVLPRLRNRTEGPGGSDRLTPLHAMNMAWPVLTMG